jgi:hypothetical protein
MTSQREADLCQYRVMSDVMDLVLLRQLVGEVIATLRITTPTRGLGGECTRLGLP